VAAAEELRRLYLESNYELQRESYRRIKELETKGDQIAATIYDELNKTFVTPFDREDIHVLASKIDTFLDFIHDAARKFVMYKPASPSKDLIIIVDSILEDAKLVSDIAKELENIAKKNSEILIKCKKIKEIEHKVDELYEEYNTFLFQNERDAIELVKNKNIVQSLEDATDRAKDIADSIRSIIIKLA
jgi:predicted phosphate transport protein (TIGR00153 family)